jgi:hypothetical protein
MRMPGLPAAGPIRTTAKAIVTISATTARAGTDRIAMTTIPAIAKRIISIPIMLGIAIPIITIRSRRRMQRTA